MGSLALAPAIGRDALRGRYQEQDSPQTLAEGLAEYYALNAAQVRRPQSLPAESAQLFRSHDICHVIFGLGVSLADEAMADTRTLVSCDVGWRRYGRYGRYLAGDPQAKAIFAQTGYLTVAWATVRALPRLSRAIIAAWRKRKPWPWLPPDDHFTRPLADLRREYGIRVL
ncbi:MAG TPA: hypothetical protein VMU93_00920 [Caulobacteraceae bacterium]|nr:hypothetical protein [Caulobacteraceae bacterium]